MRVFRNPDENHKNLSSCTKISSKQNYPLEQPLVKSSFLAMVTFVLSQFDVISSLKLVDNF